MGFLSSVGKFLTTNPVGKVITKTLDTATVVLAHPIQTATAIVSKKSTVQDVVTSHFAQPVGKQVKDILLGTAGIAATVVGGVAIGGAAKAGTLAPKAISVAKALIPATTKGKVIAAGATYVAAAAVIEKPSLAVSAPKDVLNFGGDLGKLIASPSVEKAKELISESPVISAGAGLLLAGGAIKSIAPAIALSRQTEAIQEQTEVIKSGAPMYSTMPVTPTKTVITESPMVIAAPTATTAQTNTVSKSSGTVRRPKRKSVRSVPNVSQRVNVIVGTKVNSIGMKNYIKRGIYN